MDENNLDERVLPDDYPIYKGYLYVYEGVMFVGGSVKEVVIDSWVFRAEEDTTAGMLRRSVSSNLITCRMRIKNCDIIGRDLVELMV